jgi:hypothetical protein
MDVIRVAQVLAPRVAPAFFIEIDRAEGEYLILDTDSWILVGLCAL